jgi:hypothetical protein
MGAALDALFQEVVLGHEIAPSGSPMVPAAGKSGAQEAEKSVAQEAEKYGAQEV